MMKTTRYARTSALPAIAAVLALSSTSAFAQDAQPVTVAPPSPVAADPAPVVEPAPVTTVTPVETTAPVADTSEPAATPVAAKPVRRATRTATARPAAPATKVASRPAPVAQPAPAGASAPVADPVSALATAPAAQPAPAAPVTADAEPAKSDNTVPIAAGGALAFLALGGAAVAMTRRRRHEEEEEVWIDEEPIEPMAEPEALVPPAPMAKDTFVKEQPLILGPSAFAWGNERAASTRPAATTPAVEAATDDDRRPGESWVERAYRGPTPNNPSVSLRNRLRRAAFFDQRERAVAAGHAEPVDMTAGLPDAMVEEQERERELA